MASTSSMIIVLICIFIFTIIDPSGLTDPESFAVQASGCGGLIQADNGRLQLEPSSKPCLWVITLVNKTGIRMELSPFLTRILVTHQQGDSPQDLTSVWINGSQQDVYNFAGKSLTIMAPNRTEISNFSWTGLNSDTSQISVKFANTSNDTFLWKHERNGRDQISWAFHPGTNGKLDFKLDTLLPACYPEDPCQSVSLAMFQIMADGNMSELQRTCEGSIEGSLNLTKGTQMLVLLYVNAPVEATTSFQVNWKYDERFTRNVEGIIARQILDGGLVLIPFSSTKFKINGSGTVYGTAYDWNSSHIYWLELGVGIKRANLDDSESKLMLADTSSDLLGMAIDPVNGNLYFGNRSSETIRVRNNKADKCSSIDNSSDLSNIWDLAVHWSKGFLFWSIFFTSVVRASLDGSNRTIMLEGHRVQGIDVDEEADRLYWGSEEGIGSCDLNGGDIRMLPNFTTDGTDVAIDAENIYYTDFYNPGIFVISKLGTNSKLVASLTEGANYIDLYGKRISNFPQNPCDHSKCEHLCVLTSPSSSRCLCPDGEKLDADGTTCNAG